MKNTRNIPARAAGVLLPVSSLPSPYGIGSFNKDAYKWIDFLADAGHQYWQVLPLGPTSFGDSPYQSFSAFAGNPYFIDLDALAEENLLKKEEYSAINWGNNPGRVDYSSIYQHRESILRIAFSRFTDFDALSAFAQEHSFWLENYALYMAIKSTQDNKSWIDWEENLKMRVPSTIKEAKKDLAQDVQYHIFVQFEFSKQWDKLRTYANKKGIEIIGDIPIYVSLDSADVWQNKDWFQLDENAMPTAVAGVPPDSFSADGQLWGNPLYRWDIMQADGYKWWIKRIEATFAWYDILRIDHFRGLESYYAIPFPAKNARKGSWRKGPGMDLINALKNGVPDARFIAEDLGFLTDGVRQLLKDSEFPGMKVLQFAFDSREAGDYTPYTYEANTVVYTGTHDNDTMLGWIQNAPAKSVQHAMDYIGLTQKDDMVYAMIRLAFQTKSNLVVVPMQDWLLLNSDARINTPSTIGGINWQWRLKEDEISLELGKNMLNFTQLYGRELKRKKPAKESLPKVTQIKKVSHKNKKNIIHKR